VENVIHIHPLQHVDYHIYDHFVHAETVKFVQTLFLVLCVWGDIRRNCKYFPTRVSNFDFWNRYVVIFFFCKIRTESNDLEASKC
jgi:hypothetical protein